MPIIAVRPLHQGCSVSQASTSSTSSSSCSKYSSVRTPSESPLPRRSTRRHAYPWPAIYGWWIESRTAVKSRLRYGIISNTAGTGSSPAETGFHSRAASLVPSVIGTQRCSVSSIEVGNEVTVRIMLLPHRRRFRLLKLYNMHRRCRGVVARSLRQSQFPPGQSCSCLQCRRPRGAPPLQPQLHCRHCSSVVQEPRFPLP